MIRLLEEVKKLNSLFIFKSAIGSTLAILIANRLNLLYSATAGIITLLTIQKTRKETLKIAFKRIAGFFLAVLLAYFIFSLFDFTTFAFGLFVFIFVALANILSIEVGVVMNSVLVTHFLVEGRMDLALIRNEGLILLIGMAMGIIVNSIMATNQKEIREEQKVVEERMRESINCLSKILRKQADEDYLSAQRKRLDLLKVEELIDQLLEKAYEDAGNQLLSETRYQISYLEMRKQQMAILKEIEEEISELSHHFPHATKTANYMEKVSQEFTEANNVKTLLADLEDLVAFFREEPLPESREEFETRAILFHLLRDLNRFLETKRKFVNEDAERSQL